MSNHPEPAADGGVTGFAERLLAVIDEGRRTATYKLALLIALMDCCAEGVSPMGAAPAEIPTRSLARQVARLYWRQLRPFPSTHRPASDHQQVGHHHPGSAIGVQSPLVRDHVGVGRGTAPAWSCWKSSNPFKPPGAPGRFALDLRAA